MIVNNARTAHLWLPSETEAIRDSDFSIDLPNYFATAVPATMAEANSEIEELTFEWVTSLVTAANELASGTNVELPKWFTSSGLAKKLAGCTVVLDYSI